MLQIESFIKDIKNLCSKHKVKSLYVFGSALTNKFTSNSDVDFIVDFETVAVNEYADNYYDLKFSLEDILHRPIDLLEEQAIKNPYFKKVVNEQRQLVYGH